MITLSWFGLAIVCGVLQNQKIKISLLFALLPVMAVQAQNLVPNSSFEEYYSCPGNFTQSAAEFRVKDWRSATAGSPDHFHACSRGEANVPHNWAGVSDAYDGSGYAGIYGWMDNKNDYREYLQCRLLEPLVKDSLYVIEFHFKLSSYSRYSIDRIGLLLTDTALQFRHDRVLSCEPTVSVIQDSALTKKTGYWETARYEYRAKGGEQFLTIGNFFNNSTTHHYQIRFSPVQQSMLENSAYYYIDAVNVTPKFIPGMEAMPLIPGFSAEAAALNETYVLKNINFEFDSYRLTFSSFEELDGVVAWLEQHPSIKVLLSGHTDDVGGDRYNLLLSRNRSKSVATYLIAQGIEARRVESYGYGKTRPLVQEASPTARKLNRRVEVKFVE